MPGNGFFEYTFETALGPIFVVSPDLTDVLALGAEVGLTLADHGVSVVAALSSVFAFCHRAAG